MIKYTPKTAAELKLLIKNPTIRFESINTAQVDLKSVLKDLDENISYVVNITDDKIFDIMDNYTYEKYNFAAIGDDFSATSDYTKEDLLELSKQVSKTYKFTTKDIDPLLVTFFPVFTDGYEDEDFSELIIEFISKNIDSTEDEIKVLINPKSKIKDQIQAFFLVFTKLCNSVRKGTYKSKEDPEFTDSIKDIIDSIMSMKSGRNK